MDYGTVSLGVSVVVCVLQVLQYLNVKTAKKEAGLERFARADSVANELIVISKNIIRLEDKLEDHGSKIADIQLQNAICYTERDNISDDIEQQIKLLEKLNDKIEKLNE